jgi:hypothetical protein
MPCDKQAESFRDKKEIKHMQKSSGKGINRQHPLNRHTTSDISFTCHVAETIEWLAL